MHHRTPGSDAGRFIWLGCTYGLLVPPPSAASLLRATHEGVVIGYTYASPPRARAAYRWAVDMTVCIAKNGREAVVQRGSRYSEAINS